MPPLEPRVELVLLPLPDDPDDPADEDPDDEDPADEDPEDPPLSRGTAVPTVSPFEGRDPDCPPSGADLWPAHAGARLRVNAEAIKPTVSF